MYVYGYDQRVVSTHLFFFVLLCFLLFRYISAACLTTVPSAYQYLGITRTTKWTQWILNLGRVCRAVVVTNYEVMTWAFFTGGTGEKNEEGISGEWKS